MSQNELGEKISGRDFTTPDKLNLVMLDNFRGARTQIKQFVVMKRDANTFAWLIVGTLF